MIIREYIACETCEHLHTVRIGLGDEKYQTHNFPCSGCGENITIALEIGTGLILKENAVQGMEEGTVVNLDSLFLANPANTGVDHVKQRVEQTRELFIAKKAYHDQMHGEGSFEKMLLSQTPNQLVSILDEWQVLKRCWSLHKNKKYELVKAQVSQANKQIYNFEPLNSFHDWLWRFSSRISGNIYNDQFENAVNSIIRTCIDNSKFDKLVELIRNGLFEDHLEIYFYIFKQFFENYSHFNQVYLYCSVGIDIPDGNQATSRGFDDISGFYGNAFESFTSLVETLAYINNVMLDRAFDQFETMTIGQYKKTGKAGRCNPFATNQPFTKLCEDVDNKLRNASHHGNFRFNQETGVIKYRDGKGGSGKEQEIIYTDYIVKCTNLFLAIVTLLRIELVMHEHM